jgi:hypothetical protein
MLQWAAQNNEIKLMTVGSSGNHLIYEGYEDSEEFCSIVDFCKQHSLRYEINGRKRVYCDKELNQSAILLMVINEYSTILTLQQKVDLEGCFKCGVNFKVDNYKVNPKNILKKDLVQLTDVGARLISKKIKDKIEQEHLIGCGFREIEGTKEYYELVIDGNIGEPVDLAEKKTCPECNQTYASFSTLEEAQESFYNIHFLRSTYKDTDFAEPPVILTGIPKFIVISNKTYKTLKENKATGFYVIPANLD